jgi:signal transduction histidine kinase
LILLYLIIDFILFFVNLVDPQGVPWVLVSGVLVSILSLVLLREGYTNLAIFFYLLRANVIVFFFARQEEIGTGTFIYFLSYGITPLAFYGYQERWKGIVYSLLSFVLFLISNFELENFKPDHAHFNFILNYAFVLLTLSFIILFFDRINQTASFKINNQNKELRKTNEELDRFVYSVSHDLRSPLASILGLVSIYELETSDQEKQNIVKLIRGRTLKLEDFINKILDYSRNSRVDKSQIRINFYHLVVEVVDSLRYIPDFDLVDIKINIAEDLTLFSDSDRLKIILSNVIGNAIKYIDRTKEKHFVTISTHYEGDQLRIIVDDNGIGIATHHQEGIFEMFYRATQASDGSGIGLYIARECASKLGGQISVQSQENVGTLFQINLPKEDFIEGANEVHV